MGYKTVEVDVDIDLEDFDDDELEDEMLRRGLNSHAFDPTLMDELINNMYEKFRRNENIDVELRKFFYDSIGRIA